jgi:pSer/pThr/pTyr-binding forkhead associated (FHA) protein
VVVEGSSVYVEDLGSKNGTFVAGRPVQGKVRLADGDTLELGSVSLIFRGPMSDRSTRTWKRPRPPGQRTR